MYINQENDLIHLLPFVQSPFLHKHMFTKASLELSVKNISMYVFEQNPVFKKNLRFYGCYQF